MAACEYACPALACEVYLSDNLPGTHYCPVHGLPMIRAFDEERFEERDYEENDDDE